MECSVMRPVFHVGRGLCAAAAAAAIVSSVAGLCSLYALRTEYRALNAEARESAALLAAAEKREATLARCKSLLRHDGVAPPQRPDSANKFYSALLESLSECGLAGAQVSGATPRGGVALFVISGRAQYAQLTEFLLSLRTFPYIARVSALSAENTADGCVAFSLEVSTIISDADGVEN